MTRAFSHLPSMNISQQMTEKVTVVDRENPTQKHFY